MKKSNNNKSKRERAISEVKIKSWIIGLLVAIAVILFINYFFIPAWNLQSVGFWTMIICASVAFTIAKYITLSTVDKDFKYIVKQDKTIIFPVVLLLAVLIAGLAGTTVFHASEYSKLITVEEAVFEEDLAESLNTDVIALMDTKSARMLGDREIGTLSNVVSQYDVSDDYTQIDLKGTPKKVAALDYAGFFKWMNNKSSGIPGYILVDPVSMSASYQPCDEGLIYVPSAYFGQDASRYIRKHYPTEIFGNLHFEVDEEGNPYYIATVYDKTIIFGGTTVKGAIILNPVNGDLEYYLLSDVPVWADDVYDGDLICEQYNWYGKLQNGFWNSIFGKKGCKQVTEYRESEDESDDTPVSDYGYVAKDGDIWIYTGVTSVNNDSSNIGFLLANERTGEAHYYNISGADEASAMAAAEGEVQEKGYQASFPSLINVDGHPTYIMVLKDASGLVKLYAAVNVEQYNLVTTAVTQDECIRKYRSLIGTGDIVTEVPEQSEEEPVATDETTIEIIDIKYVVIDGDTYIYLIDAKEDIYRAKVGSHEEMLLLKSGDVVSITHAGKEIVTCERE